MLREQLLVGRHHVTPRLERARDVVEGGIDAADQLDDDLAPGQDPVEVPALAAEHAADPGTAAGHLLDHVGALVEQPAEGTADGAAAENPDVDDLAH